MNTIKEEVRVPGVWIQPVAADDVVELLAEIVFGSPINRTLELAGPEPFALNEVVGKYLSAVKDSRRVDVDDQVRYFVARPEARSLLPGESARISSITFDHWLEDHSDR